MNQNVLLVLFLFYIKQSIQKILSYNYTYIWNTPSANVYFKEDNNTFKAYFNTYLPFSFFDGTDDYQRTSPTKIQNESNTTLTYTYESLYYQSSMLLYNIKIPQYNFKISKSKIRHTLDLGIALGYKYIDESYSFIHYLYRNRYIDNLRFTFEPFIKENDSSIIYM